MPRKKDLEGIEVSEVLERHDPDLDVEADSDPTFEAKITAESQPEDKHVVLVHKEDVGRYKGARYEAIKGGSGVELECGQTFAEGEDMTYREHTYMARDKSYHDRREKAERAQNRQLRGRMIKAANKTVFVNTPGQARS